MLALNVSFQVAGNQLEFRSVLRLTTYARTPGTEKILARFDAGELFKKSHETCIFDCFPEYKTTGAALTFHHSGSLVKQQQMTPLIVTSDIHAVFLSTRNCLEHDYLSHNLVVCYSKLSRKSSLPLHKLPE